MLGAKIPLQQYHLSSFSSCSCHSNSPNS